MNPDFKLHREDVDHATVDVEQVFADLAPSRELRIGLEAVAALKAHLYRDAGRTDGENVRHMLRWQVVSCLLGVNWKDPEIVEAVQDGTGAEAVKSYHERDRARLIEQALFLGAAISRHLDEGLRAAAGPDTGTLMRREDFSIGSEFVCGGRRWRCTDVGTRTVAAIPLEGIEIAGNELSQEEAEAGGWLNGPPYAVAETVFDEDDMMACEPVSRAFQA